MNKILMNKISRSLWISSELTLTINGQWLTIND